MAHPLVSQQAESITLPAAPDTVLLRQQATDRLLAITTNLASLAERRAWLEKVWRDDSDNAVPIYDEEGVSLFHEVGADRVATIMAEQHSLLVEAHALRELLKGLALYDAGGSMILSEIATSTWSPTPGSQRPSRRRRSC
jgi:hypothetical protein